jgi:exonuclease VII large subunit
VSDASGSVVTDSKHLKAAQKLKVHLAKGAVNVQVSAERQAEFFEPDAQTP